MTAAPLCDKGWTAIRMEKRSSALDREDRTTEEVQNRRPLIHLV